MSQLRKVSSMAETWMVNLYIWLSLLVVAGNGQTGKLCIIILYYIVLLLLFFKRNL